MEIEPFEEADVPGAAALVAARHVRLRVAEPLLPAEYDSADVCAGSLNEAIGAGAAGLVARGDRGPEGFLLAARGDDARGVHVWTDLVCHAVAGEPEVMRRLYSELATGWVAEGRGHHYVVSPTDPGGAGRDWTRLGFGDAGPGVWLSLGFGHEQVHGARSTEMETRSPDGLSVRRAAPEDLDALEPLFPLIAGAHEGAPTFAYIEQRFYDELRPGHLELLEDPSVGYWVAESDGAPLGFAALRPVPDAEASILHPKGSVELLVAATTLEARGRGVMGALLGTSLTWAREEGFKVCVTDWRAANLASSSAWPRLGFNPVAYRLHRIVDPRTLP
jgi:GNAT superfamily N-acetyltransferase